MQILAAFVITVTAFLQFPTGILLEVVIIMVFFFLYVLKSNLVVLEKLLFTEFETSESSVSNADPWTSNLPPISSVRWDGSSYALRPLLTFVKAYGKQQRLFSASTYLIYTYFIQL